MPSPLLIRDISDIDIDTPRASNSHGWKYEFKYSNDTVAGTIYDNEDTFSDGAAVASGVDSLKLVATLDADAAFAIQDFDFITITVDYNDGKGYQDLKIWLPAYTGTDPITWYIDSDGNTYTDSDLATAAGGVALFSDSVYLVSTLGPNYNYENSLSDICKIVDSLSSELSSFNFNLSDVVFISDVIQLAEIISFLYQLEDVIFITDHIEVLTNKDWIEETSSQTSWSEET